MWSTGILLTDQSIVRVHGECIAGMQEYLTLTLTAVYIENTT